MNIASHDIAEDRKRNLCRRGSSGAIPLVVGLSLGLWLAARVSASATTANPQADSSSGAHVFSGVRPSPGAAMLGPDLAFEPFNIFENAELAVAEDGHSPPNRYSGAPLLTAQALGLGKSGVASAPSGGENYGRLPLAFESNAGQAEAQTRFLARGRGYCLSLRPTEAVLVLRQPTDGNAPRLGRNRVARNDGPARLRLQLLGAAPQPEVAGLEKLPGKVNYLVGNNPTRWRRDLPAFAKVSCRGVYPGIDLVYYGNEGQLEYDFIVAPGADPKAISLCFEGAEKIEVDERGDLVLTVSHSEVRFHRPVVYQEVNGMKEEVPGGYVLCDGTIGFAVGSYDSTRSLVIDPVLSYSTYLGGSGLEKSWGIAVDAAGSAYVVGETESAGLATSNAFQRANRGGLGGGDAFVAKLNSNGTALVYQTYIGGSGADGALSIALDPAGNAYVAGFTYSTDFPTTNAFQSVLHGTLEPPYFLLYPPEGFVAKLNTNGSALLYSTYFGGSGADEAIGIAVDAAGSAYVTGFTASSDFPTSINALQKMLGQQTNGTTIQDAFVAKIDTTQVGTNSLIYSTYLGGDNVDQGEGIAVDGAGNAYVTGETSSTNFWTTNAFQAGASGGFDVFVTKLNADGSALLYSTLLGGDGDDFGLRIALDAAGSAYVAGEINSPDFPATPGTINKGGVFKSVNGGGNWSAANAGLANNRINDLAISPAASTTIYVATQRGLFQSVDGAGNWISDSLFFLSINALAIDPTAPSTLYAGTTFGVFKSTDGGGTWTNQINGFIPFVHALVIATNATSTLYAGTEGGIFKSTDGGTNWQSINVGLGNLSVNDLVMDPVLSTILYAGTAAGMFKSTNGGTSWQGINSGLTSLFVGLDVIVSALAIDPTAPSTLYAGTTFFGVFKSTDGGSTWTDVNNGLANFVVNALAIDPSASSTLYAGTDGGVFKTSNGGASWTNINTGLADLRVNTLAVDPTTPATVYAGARGDYPFGGPDAFVAKLSPPGSALVYSARFGGGGADRAWDLAVDSAGNLYAVGETTSTSFPVVNSVQTTNAGSSDAFVVKLNADASQLVYSTYLGGGADDFGYGIAVDSNGNAYVTGLTFSSGFPSATNALQLAAGGNGDVFVTKLVVVPTLAFTRTGNFVTVSWPAPSDFVLESAASLGPPVAWTPVSTTPTVVNGQNTVTINASTGAQFFRLRR